ncbi:acyl-CoA thioesterase [Aliiroseovarius sp. 2305UL8-7]|uniref:acyl-CoA thioesterase n=1 Tax=Aliiroseovarius conchicola TaxID=3121637 RepID=UPI003526E324
MTHFKQSQKVLFRHCDPAGIVFFPRACEIVNDVVEALFAGPLGWPFDVMHPMAGVPTVWFNVEFYKPSFHGDVLELALAIKRLGVSSLALETTAICEGETRFTAEHTIVCVSDDRQSMPWPDHVRKEIEALMKETA